MTICYTGVCPAELVNNERKPPKDGSLGQLFGTKIVMSACAIDEDSKKLNELLIKETVKHGRPKALCYEDILMMIVCDPDTGRATPAMALKFIFHKGCDNRSKLYASCPRCSIHCLF
jgi:hypothetical protein